VRSHIRGYKVRMRRLFLAVLLTSVSGLLVDAAVAAAPASRPAPPPVEGTPNPRDLDLADLVPRSGRLDYVWYVPAGRAVPQVVVAWHFRDRRPVVGWDDHRRYVLTLWSPEDVTPGAARWVPHTLIRASPFPLVGRSVRLADVSGDGHDDLLVTVMCSECNHATAVASIYAQIRGRVRRIYGHGYLGVVKGPGHDAGVHGRVISETGWGARDGMVWFDTPVGGSSVCCPAFRLQTFLRWTSHGWRTVAQRHASPTHDPLLKYGYPAP
jgi:hypothetical protein